MKGKNFIFFILALALSFLAATHRWGDSAHSIGTIRASGGEVRHPPVLKGGENTYTLIATATVIPPYNGDARVVLEGDPSVPADIYMSAPIVDFGIRRNPVFRDNVLYGLQPLDRIALWVVMKPPVLDPVCGMVCEDKALKASFAGKDHFFCSEECAEAFNRDPEKYRGGSAIKGKYDLAFYDTKTNRQVLRVPIMFKGRGKAQDECGQH